MKKGTLRAIAALGIVLVLYHLIVFMLPFTKNTVFWLSYGFTLTAFAVGAGAIVMAFVKNGDAKSRFYGFPIARLGLIYAAAQLIDGLVFMALGKWVIWWIPALIYALGLGVALLGLLGTEGTLEEIQTQDATLKKNVTLMRSLQSKVSQMAAQSDDAGIKVLAEEFRYSDPVSSEAIAGAEADLAATVDELQAAFVDGDKDALAQLCRKASALLAERNRLCKLNKQ